MASASFSLPAADVLGWLVSGLAYQCERNLLRHTSADDRFYGETLSLSAEDQNYAGRLISK